MGFDAGSVFRLPLLLDGLHALGHGRRGAADGIRDVKVLERLLADVERSAARLRFHRLFVKDHTYSYSTVKWLPW